MRRKVGLGALTNKQNVDSISKQLSDQRLEDISKAVELLEDGIRNFVQTNKEEIRNNEFLREKIKTLAATCNVDLEAATSVAGRLKPGVLSSLLGDALFGGSANSATTKKFYDFLSSRVVTLCMRERVLRGPVIPMFVVLNELRKRYPLEEITLHDIIKSIEHVKVLNPNIFVLEQQSTTTVAATTTPPSQHIPGGDATNFFIAFHPLSSSTSFSSNSLKSTSKVDASASGTDAIRIVVLANELANLRKRELIDTLKKKIAASSSSSTSHGLTSRPTGFAASAAARHNQQNPVSFSSPDALQLQQELGLVRADNTNDTVSCSTFYIRITVDDVVSRLSTSSTSSNNINSSNKSVWSKNRGKLALQAARELCEGWYDEVDHSTWLNVVVA